MSMRDQLHIPEDDLIQYALGTLKETQLGTITAHLSLCSDCRAELAKIQAALASYSTTIPAAELPEGSRDRFLKAISSATISDAKAAARRNSGPQLVGRARGEWAGHWFNSPTPFKVLSGALAAALIFLIYDDVSHIHEIRQLGPEMRRMEITNAELQQMKSFLGMSNLQQVTLREKPQPTRAPEGHALYSAATGKLLFTAANMPALSSGKVYELWIIPVTGAPIPAGTFTPDTAGNASVVFPRLQANVQAGAFGVTVENEGGSDKPTSAILISGQ